MNFNSYIGGNDLLFLALDAFGRYRSTSNFPPVIY